MSFLGSANYYREITKGNADIINIPHAAVDEK